MGEIGCSDGEKGPSAATGSSMSSTHRLRLAARGWRGGVAGGGGGGGGSSAGASSAPPPPFLKIRAEARASVPIARESARGRVASVSTGGSDAPDAEVARGVNAEAAVPEAWLDAARDSDCHASTVAAAAASLAREDSVLRSGDPAGEGPGAALSRGEGGAVVGDPKRTEARCEWLEVGEVAARGEPGAAQRRAESSADLISEPMSMTSLRAELCSALCAPVDCASMVRAQNISLTH